MITDAGLFIEATIGNPVDSVAVPEKVNPFTASFMMRLLNGIVGL